MGVGVGRISKHAVGQKWCPHVIRSQSATAQFSVCPSDQTVSSVQAIHELGFKVQIDWLASTLTEGADRLAAQHQVRGKVNFEVGRKMKGSTRISND